MGARRLSDRALMILQHIADVSANGLKWLSGSARGMDDYDKPSGVWLNIGGSGDAAILRALVRSGLLRREAPESDYSNQYQWLASTPIGRQHLEVERDRVAEIRRSLQEEESKLNRRAEDSWITERHWSL
jgi:hypothetical protein